ncbi:hypothetical protein LC613_36185 [Nostoc sphaeroides CHAB 2801]|uniref:hypothetical protein n=1 Tax=Nostoc sphaeroides TaxID=446679 RepID=UPI001E49D23F|nr:hypothetical protein [Nostoc sphaeroides]MCC5632974.1 hypothetical protein [Nostoc sphaeroides CHAB 2801]
MESWVRLHRLIIDIPTPLTDTHDIPQTFNKAVQAGKGLKLKMQQGLEGAGSLDTELVSKVGHRLRSLKGQFLPSKKN